MVKRASKVLLATALVAGLTATIYGCGIIGTIDFDVKFQVPALGAGAGSCQWAMVPNVKFQFLDQALDGMLRTEVTRPCVPGERYKVSIDIGPYNIRVQGISATLSICYEVNQLYQVQGGKTDVLTLTAVALASGPAAGCAYPTTPAP
jgi:hypothetical protein